MKKILFVISQFYKGGAELSLINLFDNLDYSKYSVDFVILNQTPNKEAVSLVPKINSNVNLCDAFDEYESDDKIRGIYAAIKRRMGLIHYCSPAAIKFVKNKEYDWAFFVGEWYSPVFIVRYVNAIKKAIWIHNDLSKAEYFNADEYFKYDKFIDRYIFVSQQSLKQSISKYPMISNKSLVVYNMINYNEISKHSKEQVDDILLTNKLPILVTCANVRAQKNHLRQVMVLAELRKRGIEIEWLNIGALSDSHLVEEVKALAMKEGVSEHYHLLGARENPYKYMKMASAITVLSDYESWSMVITEAKALGIPVIATRTSGAVEQITSEQYGFLCEFDAKNIADTIEKFLTIKVNRKVNNEMDLNSMSLKVFEDLLNKQ